MTQSQEPDVGNRVAQLPAGARATVFKELVFLWLGALLLIRLLVEIEGIGAPEVVLVGVPLLFIYAPIWLCSYRGVDSFGYRLHIPAFRDRVTWWAAIRINLKLLAIITVPWLIGYHFYQTLLFGASPGHEAPLFEGFESIHLLFPALADLPGGIWAWWNSSSDTVQLQAAGQVLATHGPFLTLVAYQLFFVALPEEFFYRGYFQTRLNEVFPRKWLVFGVPMGWGSVLAALFFAFGHTVVLFQWWHFATFFPGLIFAWLRERTGGVVAGALFHATCNIGVVCLDTYYGIIPA